MYEILCSQQEDRPRDALQSHTTPVTRRTLAVTLVARPDAATVLLATIAVCHLLHHLVLPHLNPFVQRFFAVAVHAITVFALFWSAPIFSASLGEVPVI